jgi:hypothetical protein
MSARENFRLDWSGPDVRSDSPVGSVGSTRRLRRSSRVRACSVLEAVRLFVVSEAVFWLGVLEA